MCPPIQVIRFVPDVITANLNERSSVGWQKSMSTLNYDYPGVEKPFAHQIETTKFLVDNPRCFLWSDIGTGKTWSTVWAIDILMQRGDVKNVLIVAPISTLTIVWYRTFFALARITDVQILRGTAAQRKKLFERKSDRKISIINPDALHILVSEKAIEDYQMIVVDESALFRNARSRRCKALAKLTSQIDRLVCISGSPMPEAPTDIWATARLVCPSKVPKWFGQFRDLTMRKVNQYNWVALPDAQQKISSLLNGSVIRFSREDCIDLPESLHHTLELEASNEQKRMLQELRRTAVATFGDETVHAANEAVVVSKMLQVAAGAVKFAYRDKSGVIEVDAASKFEILLEILEASAQPVIVFCPYRAVVERVASFLREETKHKFSVVTGDTSHSDRVQAFNDLQNGNIKVLVAHPQVMAHGITLTNSNVVIWWSPVYSHEMYEQANGRVVRPGQVKKTYFVHLTCCELERRVLTRLKQKSKFQGVLLDMLNHDKEL